MTGTDGVDEGDGQYSQTTNVQSREVTEVGLRVVGDSSGCYALTGAATYYGGDNEANATTWRIHLPLVVTELPAVGATNTGSGVTKYRIGFR